MLKLFKLGKFPVILISCLILGSMLIFAGCGDDDDNPTSTQTVSPFAGSWDIEYTGDESGKETLFIGNSGGFSFTEEDGNKWSGTVASNGQVGNGTISDSNTKIGTISGMFSGDSGNGNWDTDDGSRGTWTASK